MMFDLRELRDYFDASAQSRGDATANLYGAASGEISALYDEVVQEVLRVLQPEPEARIVDIGCGTGEVLARMAVRYPQVTGVDLSPTMVRIAASKGYRAVACDGAALPFEDSVFDVVLPNVILDGSGGLEIGD